MSALLVDSPSQARAKGRCQSSLGLWSLRLQLSDTGALWGPLGKFSFKIHLGPGLNLGSTTYDISLNRFLKFSEHSPASEHDRVIANTVTTKDTLSSLSDPLGTEPFVKYTTKNYWKN